MYNWCTLTSILLVSILIQCQSAPQGGDNLPDDKEIKRASNVGGESSDSDAFLVVNNDGSYDHGHQNRDRGAAYHFAQANARNVVRGRFGSRSPANGRIQETAYTAGPRGFRPRGENIHRKYDLSQAGPVRPIGNKDDPYFDPSEDPSYSFGFRTSTYTRQEDQNRIGDVTGRYTFIDDIGERHNVEYIAGARTGFHIHTPYPDSNPPPYGPLYFSGPGKKPRGHTSVQRNLDGSYRYVAQGPDQRKTETKDSSGVVRGSYTYLDDKGKQRSVYYIAGPGIGYRVLKNAKDYNVLYPFSKNPPISSPLPQLKPEVSRPPRPGQSPADSVGDGDGDGEDIPQSVLDDILFNGPKENLNTAASGYEKPKPGSPTSPGASFGTGPGVTGGGDLRPQEVPSGPSFGGPGVSGSEFRPTQEGAGFPSTSFGTGPAAGSGGFRPQPTGNGFPKPKPPQFGINGGAGAGSGTTGSGFPDSSGTRPDFPETGSGFPKPGAGGTRPSSGETGFAGFQPTNPAAQFGAGTGPDGNGFGSGEDKPFKPKPPGSGEKLPGGSGEKPGFDFDSNSIGSDQDEDGGYPKPPSNQFGSSGETGLIPGAPSRPGTAGQSGSRPIDQKPFGSNQGRPSTDGDEYDDKYDSRPKPSRPFGQDGAGQSKPSRPAGGGAGQGLPEDSSASETDMYGSGGDDYGSGQDTGAGFQKPKPDGGTGGFGSGGSSEFGSGGTQGGGSQFEGAGGLDSTGGGQFGSGAGRPGGTQFGGGSPDQEGSQFGGGGGTSQVGGSQFGGSGRPSTPQGGGRPPGAGGRPQGVGGRPQGSGGRPGGGAGGRPQGGGSGGGGGRPPSGGRPGGGGSGRPSQTGDFGDEEDVDVFGEGPGSRPTSGNDDKYRPSGDKPSSQEKPSSGGQFTGTIGISTDTGESGDFDNKRPIVTVSEEDSDYDVFNSGGGGGRPGGDRPPGGGGRPTGDRPQGSGGRPPAQGRPPSGGRPSGGRPSGGIRPGGVDTDEGYSRPMHGTILRNLGDETIGIRPGVSVRAHVQQIDLLPYGSRVPSPGEQLNKDIKNNE